MSYYHVMHSPRGAGASIAYGAKDDPAGFMHGEGFLPVRDLYIGIRRGKTLTCLPFYPKGNLPEAEEQFDVQATIKRPAKLYKEENATHVLGMASDTWLTDALRFTLYTPVAGLCDPKTATDAQMADSLLPALAASLTVHNTSEETVYGFFGAGGMDGVYPLAQTDGALVGAGCAAGFGFAASVSSGTVALADFSPTSLMSRREPSFYQNCAMGALEFAVPPHSERTLRFALGWYRDGSVTRGAHRLKYAYTNYFDSLEHVLRHAIGQLDAMMQEAAQRDAWLESQPISAARKFMLAYAVHSYWASTLLFADDGGLRYVVNEGSYMMMNTFDLSVDHLFYECTMQPWTVKNQLAYFAKEYAYRDTVHAPGGEAGLLGGITFTHDQGSYASFTREGYSAYEMREKTGCLSYMSQEQLCNWLLCAGVYGAQDASFATEYAPLLRECLTSMQNRDHFDPAQRDGVMDFDSDRCGTQWEITTYDSLDNSLGQARRSLYLAGKCWASYLALHTLLTQAGEKTLALEALCMAELCANTITAAYDARLGYIPALLEPGNASAIIPAIEGLCYPYFFDREALADDGPFAALIDVMKKHLRGVLTHDHCLFADDGWRLSASSINSWMSKIFLNEFVAECILGREETLQDTADLAHMRWWQDQCCRCPSLDQVCWGQEYSRGFHYPRAVTAILWTLKEQAGI